MKHYDQDDIRRAVDEVEAAGMGAFLRQEPHVQLNHQSSEPMYLGLSRLSPRSRIETDAKKPIRIEVEVQSEQPAYIEEEAAPSAFKPRTNLSGKDREEKASKWHDFWFGKRTARPQDADGRKPKRIIKFPW